MSGREEEQLNAELNDISSFRLLIMKKITNMMKFCIFFLSNFPFYTQNRNSKHNRYYIINVCFFYLTKKWHYMYISIYM